MRRLAQLMGGKTDISSEPGKGTRVWIRLPLAAAAAPLKPFVEELTRAGRRILVVEDNESNRLVLRGQLSHAGDDVCVASSGSDALVQMAQAVDAGTTFEVVLCDHEMPDTDGTMLDARVKDGSRFSNSRMIMLTSLDHHGDIQRFASLGFAGYLTKPAGTRTLCLSGPRPGQRG